MKLELIQPIKSKLIKSVAVWRFDSEGVKEQGARVAGLLNLPLTLSAQPLDNDVEMQVEYTTQEKPSRAIAAGAAFKLEELIATPDVGENLFNLVVSRLADAEANAVALATKSNTSVVDTLFDWTDAEK